LVNALQTVKQRQAYKQEGTSAGALVAVFKEKSRANNSGKNNQEWKREKRKGWQSNNWRQNNITRGKERREHFPSYKFYQKTNHLKAWCWFKNAQCRSCKQFGHIQRLCKNKPEAVKQAYIAKNLEAKEDHLFMAILE